MPLPLLLYSTNTWLTWAIGQRYYRELHYCWCAPYFDGRLAPRHFQLPPSSSPAEIYSSLAGAVARGDRHSGIIERNKVGALRGALAKRKQGVITRRQQSEIGAIVADAVPNDFRPVLFVIPFGGVRALANEVPPAERAHPLSVEYLLPGLPGRRFDVLELGWPP